MNKISGFFNSLYIKLFKINDTPQKVALGLGLGVFSGILPGTGPIAALFLAFILRANRASALLGSLLTNTWMSFVTFVLAIKVGSAIMQVEYQKAYRDSVSFIKDFNWPGLFNLSILKIFLPVAVGYLVVSFCLGLLVYLFSLIIITLVKGRYKT